MNGSSEFRFCSSGQRPFDCDRRWRRRGETAGRGASTSLRIGIAAGAGGAARRLARLGSGSASFSGWCCNKAWALRQNWSNLSRAEVLYILCIRRPSRESYIHILRCSCWLSRRAALVPKPAQAYTLAGARSACLIFSSFSLEARTRAKALLQSSVYHSYWSGPVIEPLRVSVQWFNR